MLNEETTQDQANQQGTETSQDASQDTTDLQSLIQAEVAKSVDNFKNEISGLNKKISSISKEKTELEKKLQETELSKLAEDDRVKAEIELLKNEKLRIEEETALLKRSRIIDKALIDTGLPIEFAKRITGSDESEIIEDVRALSEYINQHINAGIDAGITKRLSGKAPESGKTPDQDSFEARIKKAQEAGDFVTVMALKQEKLKSNEVT